MNTPFNRTDYIVADKKYNLYKIAKEEKFRDAEPGEHLPLGYTKVPISYQLKEAYLGRAGVIETSYYKNTQEGPNSLYDIDADFIKVYLSAKAKQLVWLRDAAAFNAAIDTKAPIVGTYLLDTYGNYCTVTEIIQQDPNGGRVRRVSYQKELNKFGKPFQRKITEDKNKYYYPYNMLDKSHLQAMIDGFQHNVDLLNECVLNNEHLDATINYPVVQDGWIMQKITGSDGSSELSKDLIKSAVEALKNNTDQDMIDKFKAATETFNKYD